MRKKLRKPCPYCGRSPKRPDTIYCSIQCRTSDWKEKGIHYGGPKRKLPERVCPQCHIKFWRCYKSTFCSKKCAGEYRRDTGQLDNWIEKARTIYGPKKPNKKTRYKISIAASKRNASREYSKGIGGIRKDIGHYVRSRWEANIARILKQLGIKYQYELEHFKLIKPDDSYITYTPDFKIGSQYIEVKGWWDIKSITKKDLMKEQYPDIPIYYIDEIEYRKLEGIYAKRITNWERKTRRPKEGGKV